MDSDYWWLYGAPMEVSSVGRVTGLTFQTDKYGAHEICLGDHLPTPESASWVEISAMEFWAAADLCLRQVSALLGKGNGK